MGGLQAGRGRGRIGQGQWKLQTSRRFHAVELTVGGIELFVHLVGVDGANERPHVVTRAGGQDVGHVVAGLPEHRAQGELFGLGALSDLDLERFFSAGDRDGRATAALRDADRGAVFLALIGGLDVPANDDVVLAASQGAALMCHCGRR